jgi:antitoxin PrlF
MKRKPKSAEACGPGASCCRVEAVVAVDERGQMVLPKEVRERAGIKAGQKLAVISCGEDTCCLALVRAEALGSLAKGMLGPLFDNVAIPGR